MAKHRTYSIEFKRQVAQEFLAGESLHGLSRRHDVSRNLILGPVPRIVDPKTVRDLLRTPGPGPSPVLPRPMPTTVPDDAWPLDHRSIRCRDPTRKPILHIAPQRLIRCQLGWLRPFGGSISMPLRRRCSVVQATASGRRVAPHLAGDRRRCSLQPASNMTYASSLGAQKSNLLTFLERQVTS